MNRDDLIRRADAIKAARAADVIGLSLGDVKKVTDEVERFIETIPSVEPKQGEWIDAEIPLESGGSMPIQVCNFCKTFYPLAYTGGGHRFCPNCGARMKGAYDE